ncbi:hypothetical protein H5410_047418 [Solanum commersonii]|uniref:Uncharacterized protein n=1 Tax=Solanum commersonii TaxID=4109 RepID=A0A9J5XJ35_SOLCO|nr:hypothetical protein H5410_047418 [Solanum commersonii]
MSILSKTWLQAWSTLPNLKFFVNSWEGWEAHTKEVNTIMERYGKGKIPIDKFELSEICSGSPKLFPLVDKCHLIALQNGVKELVLHFRSYPTSIVTILATKSLRELVQHNYTLMPTLLNSCPLIVSFILENYSGMNVLKIKSDSLKVLKIIQYCKICDIDAPNLVSLDYIGIEIPELNIARELRKFLSNLPSSSEVSLCLSKCDEINMTDLQMDHIECPTFMDALLWSCHPGRLNLISIDRLMYMKNTSRYTSHGSTPWNNQLKEIKAFDGKNQLLQLGSEELVNRITEGEKPYFILEWRWS